jgi:Arc/MetJ-type ribon-helix-helix transcriptional regulator
MTIINVRTDAKTDAALAQLTADGTSRSEAIRQAILDAAREAKRRRMQEESERLRNDPEDLAEVRRIQEIMEDLGAW